MGRPGCPELALFTPSIDKNRMAALAYARRVLSDIIKRQNVPKISLAGPSFDNKATNETPASVAYPTHPRKKKHPAAPGQRFYNASININ
jgi:hypothetical protein